MTIYTAFKIVVFAPQGLIVDDCVWACDLLPSLCRSLTRAPLPTLGQWEEVSCQLCPTDQSVLLPSAPSMADRQCKQGLYSTTLVTIPTLGVYGCLGPHKAQSL